MRRDPFGQRPLYYVETEGGVRTAASARSLARETRIPASLDPDAVAAALCGVLPPTRSLFRRIRRVPPGHDLVVGSSGPSVVPYWEPPLEPDPREPAEDAACAELLRRLRSAVDRLRPRPRAACTLSGGLDSGTLLALLAEEGAPVRVWSLADDFEEDGEMDRARGLATRFGAEQGVVTVLEENLPEHALAAVRACEDLLWNGRAVAAHRFFRAIHDAGDTALLSGAGADEVLCGNPVALCSFEARARDEHALAFSLLQPSVAERVRLPPPTPPPPSVDPLIWRQHLFLRSVLPDSTLPPECRASAAEGVEVRLPYLDREVAAFCLALPLSLRARGETGKVLLREAARELLPEDIRAAPKRARLAPGGGRSKKARESWLAFYAHWLSSARVRDLRVLDPTRVSALLDDHRHLDVSDPARPLRDAVLMKLASAAILQESEAG